MSSPGSSLVAVMSRSCSTSAPDPASSASSARGVEQHSFLVNAAVEVARRLGANETSFVVGDAFDLNWRQFTALYLFEPLKESVDRQRALESAANQLENMPLQTRVATCGDLGMKFPKGYEPIGEETIGQSSLRFWLRVATW